MSDIDDVERVKYINKLKEEEQRGIINVRSCSSGTFFTVTWTHRTTGCDVISTVTTTLPVKNGYMNDIKMYNKEMRKIKAPGKKPGLNLYVSPLEDDATGGNSRSRKHFNDILRAEKVAFMSRLHKSRHQRSTIEHVSAIIIQKIFRGYWVRWHIFQIAQRKKTQSHIRQSIRSLAISKGVEFPLLSEHRVQYSQRRNQAVRVIQCAFRCFVSRIFFRRRQREYYHLRRHRAVVRIQCMARCKSAIDRVRILKERRLLYKRFRAALLLQSVYRAILCKRRVRKRMWKLRWIAARMIQSAFRGRNTRKSFAIFLAAAERIKLYRAARGVQRVVRGCIGRARIRRIQIRKLYKKVFSAATRIQTLIRNVLCNKRVLFLMSERQKKRDMITAEEALRKDLQEEKHAQELADSIDIFVQAREGHVVNVDSLYHHEMEAGGSVVTDTNEDGDTVLSVAARYGHMDIVRKCLQWGFDVNHENANGESVIALAAENGHMDVVAYIMSTSATTSAKGSEEDSTFITSTGHIEYTDHDMGLVLTAAAKATDSTYLRTILEIAGNTHVNAKHPVTDATALHIACEVGNLEIVQLLVKSGANAEGLDDMGHSILQKSCFSDNVDVVKLVLGMNSDFSAASFPTSDEERALKLLEKDGDGKDCLLIAAIYGRSKVLKFISDIVNLESRTVSEEIGWSPDEIGCAIELARSGNVECLKLLCEANFDMTWAPENSGTTVAMAACSGGNIAMLDFLVDKNADFSVTDETGRNALHYAAECATENVIPYLLSMGSARKDGAKISASLLSKQDSLGRTVLHVVAECNSSMSFELVALEHMGIALNTRDNNGMTPLLLACSKGYTPMVLEMIRLEADATLVDNNGKNAIWHYVFGATESTEIDFIPKFDPEIVKALMKAKCPIFSSPHRGIERSAEAYRQYNPKVSTKEDRMKALQGMEPPDLFSIGNKLSILTQLSDMSDAETCWHIGNLF